MNTKIVAAERKDVVMKTSFYDVYVKDTPLHIADVLGLQPYHNEIRHLYTWILKCGDMPFTIYNNNDDDDELTNSDVIEFHVGILSEDYIQPVIDILTSVGLNAYYETIEDRMECLYGVHI